MHQAPATAAVTDFSQFTQLRTAAKAQDPAALREAARQFEGLMVQQMLKAARSSGGNDLLGGAESDVYRDLYDQQMAMQLASGRGLGIAEMMVRQMQAAAPQGDAPAPVLMHSLRRPAPAPAVVTAPMTSGTAAVSSVQEFVQKLRPEAEQAAGELGIPPEVLLAQAALETGWGRHPISHADGRPSHNYFGIKADASWRGARVEKTTHEYRDGVAVTETASFRAYGSVAEGFADYVDFVRSNPRYANALRHGGSGAHYAAGLQKAGYATDPAYADKIQQIANGRHLRGASAI